MNADPKLGSSVTSELSPGRRRRLREAVHKSIAVVAILAGAALSVAIVVHVGWRPISSSLAALGWGGFGVFCTYTLGVFGLLGLSWFVIVPNLAARNIAAFVFGRLIREAAADILPFSQLSGFAAGARAATLLGAPSVIALASAVVDLSAELVGQLLFTALGAAVIMRDAPKHFPHGMVDPILAVGLIGGVSAAALFVFSQRIGLGFFGRLLAQRPSAIRDQIAAVRATLEGLYKSPARVILSACLHFSCWIAASAGVWLVLMLMGAPLSPQAVVSLESLVYLTRSAAFLVPGAIGVFEGSYVLFGPLFGLSAEAALSLALIKRGRDLVIGLPVVLAWQALEGRRLFHRREEPLGQRILKGYSPADHSNKQDRRGSRCDGL